MSKQQGSWNYDRFDRLDGSHPFKQAVRGGYVDYGARRRHDGDVAYFNFALAKEMGLISARHPERMNRALRREILNAFCMQIINEYDLLHATPIAEKDRMPGRYMATRYLQMQHPSKQGRTSGDGRSAWNGCVRWKGTSWDISSCGVGVTRLSPATAACGEFFKSGNGSTDYGSGTAHAEEGIGAALTSETFHRNGIATERVLAVIVFPSGLSVNVRAGRNLVRPAHFLAYLKQGDLDSLRAVVDYFVDRQESNGDWRPRTGADRYRHLATAMATTFAHTAAQFESEYIFCWMDWDGDNILADGGIIDYGSVRQFGLFHADYRFDDGPRMSTSLPEQRGKFRGIVRNFAQIRDFLISGEKPALGSYRGDEVLEIFDREFLRRKRELLLRKVGLPDRVARKLLKSDLESVALFERPYRAVERVRCARGQRALADGVTWDAAYCARDLLRELPQWFLENDAPLEPQRFLSIAASSHASRRDRQVNHSRRRLAADFQRHYLGLLEAAAAASGRRLDLLLEEVARRSAVINRYDRCTGEGLTFAAQELRRRCKDLTAGEMYQLISRFAVAQTLDPDAPKADSKVRPGLQPFLDKLLSYQVDYRHTV